MKNILCLIVFLLACPNVIAQQLTEPPPAELQPFPDPIGNLNTDVPLNPNPKCCDIAYLRDKARIRWSELDQRIDEIYDEIEALERLKTNTLNDPDMSLDVKIQILSKIYENITRKNRELINVDMEMMDLQDDIHAYNNMWLLLGCGFYPWV